ncbi:MAG TPA: glycosyltransferase [Devosia sp.]|nr:glycosyltransferase [Devosia sp.]
MFEVFYTDVAPIVMFVRAFSGGGAQKDALELTNGLYRAGWPMVVATLDVAGPLGVLIDPMVPVIDLGRGKKRRMATAGPALLGVMKTLRPAVIIASEASANGLLMLASRALSPPHRPHIVLREVASPLEARRADPYWQNRLAYILAPWLYPRADRVLSLTEGVRRDLIAHFRVAPERAINLGTNAVLTEARLTALAKPTPRQPGLIVGIGRLSPEKDFATLIMAFAALHAERGGHLLILGEGSERAKLEALVLQLGLGGAVSLPGFAPDPLPSLQRASLFVSSSRHEGFGNAIVEALACGVPVVAIDAPHGPREILRQGALGTLVPPNAPRALAAAMAAALDKSPDRRALRARAADFTTERAVARFAQVLIELGATPSPVPTFEAMP